MASDTKQLLNEVSNSGLSRAAQNYVLQCVAQQACKPISSNHLNDAYIDLTALKSLPEQPVRGELRAIGWWEAQQNNLIALGGKPRVELFVLGVTIFTPDIEAIAAAKMINLARPSVEALAREALLVAKKFQATDIGRAISSGSNYLVHHYPSSGGFSWVIKVAKDSHLSSEVRDFHLELVNKLRTKIPEITPAYPVGENMILQPHVNITPISASSDPVNSKIILDQVAYLGYSARQIVPMQKHSNHLFMVDDAIENFSVRPGNGKTAHVIEDWYDPIVFGKTPLER